MKHNSLVLGCLVSIIFHVLQTGKGDQTMEESQPKKHISTDQILMFSGYFLLAMAVLLGICLWLWRNGRKNQPAESRDVNKKVAAVEDSDDFTDNPMSASTDFIKTSKNMPETSSEFSSEMAAPPSHALVVLTSPEVNGLKFEDLLNSPAELIGRGKGGSSYKVMCENPRMILAVKRIKDWEISSRDFKTRMQRLDQAKHRSVLSAMAFYSSSQEKLLVFEYQNNGSLLRRLQGTRTGEAFEWISRLNTAATIAESMAFMHGELKNDAGTGIIPHGNLKSSNILLTQTMEPRISEYGLKPAAEAATADFTQDVYALGVILLELLTGKLVADEMDVASWVVSVLREEWTVEVFDRALIREGANEERMVNLLQVAVSCVNRSPPARPAINQVAVMINGIREEEERSMDVSRVSVISSR
ncbi:PREDICTED: probable inactive receptor kinase At2g26730 [Ipomoea nil]|uniref:probable inactive receptor kinase At2g26730 n=1 Tax=Ipomoea nil TaxID=35883 RepID=UPI0009010327|nr:PREDICTED: probable inactive receptor kinase At2g26730 [Ipomoea nil]